MRSTDLALTAIGTLMLDNLGLFRQTNGIYRELSKLLVGARRQALMLLSGPVDGSIALKKIPTSVSR